MTSYERIRRFRLMAANMAAMIDWPHEDQMVRAGGGAICEKCGLALVEHPKENGLHLTCEGKLVKL